LQTPLFSSSEGHGNHQRLGQLYVDLFSTSLPGDHSNGIHPGVARTLACGGPPIEPPFNTERLTGWRSEISYPVPQHAVQSNGIFQQTLPLGPHMQMTDALGYDVLGWYNAEASHGPPQYHTQVKCRSISDPSSCLWCSLATQEAQGFLGDPINLMEPLGHGGMPLPTHSVVVNTSPILKSRARRNWPCPASGCPSSFGRRQDRNRHLLIHLPYWIHCPHPGCSWRGDRLNIFRSHWDGDSNHPSLSRDLDERQFRTYDPRPLVEKIEKGYLSIRDAKTYAISMVRKKASDVGKPELCENPWGRRKGRSVQ